MRRVTFCRRLALLTVPLLTAATLVIAAPALASPPSPPVVPDPNPATSSTEATIIEMRYTSGLFGGVVDGLTPQTPYPSITPQNPRSVTTAQIVLDDPETPGPQEVVTYCIDLDTDTTIYIHYKLGTWDASHVLNLEYVQWILNNYYPTEPAVPAGSAAEKVRAVQGAIWYFTDKFVVAPAYPTERNAVRAIVEAAQAAVDESATPSQPALPTLTVTPASIEGAVPGALVGPFVVGGNVATAQIDIHGTQVYRDAMGNVPVGPDVAPGDQLWARYDPNAVDQGFTLTGSGTVSAGAVYLYDDGNPPRTTAQALVLAKQDDVPVRASASIVPEAAGAMKLDVVINGGAAGSQDQLKVTATCTAGQWSEVQTRYVPAGTLAGTSFAFPGIPAGAECSVVQNDDGSNAAVQVDAVIDPAAVTIATGQTSTITVTDTVEFRTGTLRVDVTVDGAAAGAQGAIGVTATCVPGSAPASAVSQPFTVPAGVTGTVTAGSLTVRAGSTCTVALTATGEDTDAALASTRTDPTSAVVPADGVSALTVTNTYRAPTPTPTPTPTRTTTPPLPVTGSGGGLPWGIPAMLLAAGAAALAIDTMRRRRRV